jgi:hypothetical protein
MILEPPVMRPVVGNAMPDGSKRIAFGYQALELTPGTRSTARSSIIESASEPKLDADRGRIASLRMLPDK